MIMQSAKRTGIFRQQCLPSRLLGEQFQLQNNQLPIPDARVSSSAETNDLVTRDAALQMHSTHPSKCSLLCAKKEKTTVSRVLIT